MRNGKIAGYTHQRGAATGCKLPWRKTRLVHPGAAPERGTASPPLSEIECVSGLANARANAGGTAEGLPFVPVNGAEGFLFAQIKPQMNGGSL